MSLRHTLYKYCKLNGLEDLSCIIQLAFVNYATSNPSKNKWIYLNPQILDSYMGIGEDAVKEMLEFLSDQTDAVKRSYTFYCPEKEYEFCDAKSEEELEEDEIELVCNACDQVHVIHDKKECLYEIDFEGDRDKIVEELKLSKEDIANELVILNTNPEHIDKLAEMIASRLKMSDSQKEEAKNAIVRMLYTVKDISGLIAGISEDVATTTESINKIVKNLSGISFLENLFASQ